MNPVYLLKTSSSVLMLINGEYEAGTSVSLVSGVIVNVQVLPFLFVVTCDDDMPLVVREGGFPLDLK